MTLCGHGGTGERLPLDLVIYPVEVQSLAHHVEYSGFIPRSCECYFIEKNFGLHKFLCYNIIAPTEKMN